MKKEIFMGLMLSVATQTSYASLIGTDISLETIYQSSSSSEIIFDYLGSAVVEEPAIEFSSLLDLRPGSTIGNVSINIGDDFIEIDFDNTSPSNYFLKAYQNGYVFTFESSVAVNITNATIDYSATSLGLSSNDLSFNENQLIVNVEGLRFNTSTFARINLTSDNGVSAVPLPSAVWLFGSGLLGFAAIRRRKK